MMGSLQEDQQTLGVSILSTNRSIRWAVIILSLFSISVAIAASLWITARVMQPLGGEPVDMAAMADSLARGKLARVANDDATSGLRASMANMNNKLREIVDEVRNASEVIYTNASQVAVGSSELSSRTEQQAASLEQTASAMEQINTTVNSNADNAGRAKKIAEDARIKAEKGTSVSERTERAMQAISDSSSEIAKIISVIDEIAFQTNLLALNAAVEAARAGEQGRGFAVVADEVRNLASRTAVSAKEISALIQGSIESINEGNQLTKASNDALHEIVAAVSDVAQVITEIAAASGEQRQGIGQITAAVHQMDEVTQQNAAMVEESAAAAAMLEASSQALRNTVAFFEFEEEARDTLRLN